MLARVHHAAHANAVTRLEARDLRADLDHTADDLVAWHHRVVGVAPVVAHVVHIGVTDAAVQNFDDHVVGARAAAVKVEQAQTAGG